MYVIITKICKICKIEKDLNEFKLKTNKKKNYSYYLNFCKECEKIKNKEYQNKYNKEHRQQIKEYNKNKYIQNKDFIDKRNKQYNKRNKNKLKQYRIENKEKLMENKQRYVLQNEEKIKQYNKLYYKNNKVELLEKEKIYKRIKRKQDGIYKFKEQIRNMINNSFKRKNMQKNKKTEEILGCSIEYFISYLLNTYKNNYGHKYDGKEKVHIDHIMPLIKANTKEEVISLCNYKNLQLLKATDNLKKSCKII